MTGTPLTPTRIARIVADAVSLGDKAAAKLHKVSVRTVYRHRMASEQDPKLAEVVRVKVAETDAELSKRTIAFLDRVYSAAEKRILAGEGDIDVAALVTAAGTLDLQRRVYLQRVQHESVVRGDEGSGRLDVGRGDAPGSEPRLSS